jgi:hypothetical protein
VKLHPLSPNLTGALSRKSALIVETYFAIIVEMGGIAPKMEYLI